MRFLRLLLTLAVLGAICYGAYVFLIQPLFFPDVKILHMIDPDSLLVKENGKLKLIQLIGADAPELTGPAKGHQCFDSEAVNRAAALFASDRKISLMTDEKVGETDKYGRSLRYVYLPDGSSYNEKLLKEGLARESNPENRDYKFKNEFAMAQEEAKRDSKGIWASCSGQF